jgi:hypothetical protein
MAGKAELGKQFLDELKGKLPDSLRGNLDSILSSPEALAALEIVGSRVSPLDEERQRLQELATRLETTESRLTDWKGRLETWKTGKETELTEREHKLREREANRPTPNDPPADGGNRTDGANMTKEDVAKLVGEVLAPREAGYIAYVADAVRFSTFHQQHFKEILDVNTLVRHPQIGELGVKGVYELLHKDKLDKMNLDAEKAKEEAIRADERAKIRTEAPVDMPYPLGDGSPLDVLTMDPAQRPKGDPAAAARMYDQLVSGRA